MRGGQHDEADVDTLVVAKDRHLAAVHQSEHERYDLLSGESQRLSNSLHIQHVSWKHLDERITGHLREVTDRTDEATFQARQERFDMEIRLERIAEEKVADARAHFAEDNRVHEESDNYAKEVCEEVCNLYSDLEKERHFRAKKGQQLAEGVRAKLDEVREAIQAEQRIRLESQSTMLELFAQMGQKMEREFKASQKERHFATDRLVSLMEQVLPKLDSAQQHSLGVSLAAKLDSAAKASDIMQSVSSRQGSKTPVLKKLI